jgi:hypothetical protein|tara:strand:+ start:1247 stop:1396 length:150 start_codon:yes stop_codon:yes gene_type:complete
MVDLALLKEYPETIRQLVRNIQDIQRGKGMIPHGIRSAVERREDVAAEE